MRILALGLVALLLTACASALRWEGPPREGQSAIFHSEGTHLRIYLIPVESWMARS